MVIYYTCRMMFASNLNITFAYRRGFPKQENDWRTQTINSFGLIGPEEYLEETIQRIRDNLYNRLFVDVVVSILTISILLGFVTTV